MATLQTDEANIIDAEAINWRLIVYPILVVLIVGIGALGYYYYLQNQRDTAETNARAALIKATTPEEFLKVAEDFPQTDQATLAILRAADASFDQQDYDGALSAYLKIIENSALGEQWHDTAILGSASAYEAKGDTDKAITAYLGVARRGDESPFAPYAYHCVARIYDQRGDKANESQTLQSAAALDPDSYFTRQAQNMLKEMNAAAQPPLSVNLPGTAPANPVPVPVPAAK
jgi:tetratricopeptide (TPR) repeat protein